MGGRGDLSGATGSVADAAPLSALGVPFAVAWPLPKSVICWAWPLGWGETGRLLPLHDLIVVLGEEINQPTNLQQGVRQRNQSADPPSRLSIH